MKFIPAKCPFCQGELQIPDDKEHIICMYCGKNINVNEVIKKVDNIIHPPPPPPPLEANRKLKGVGLKKIGKKESHKAIIIITVIVIVFLIIVVMKIVNQKDNSSTVTKQDVEKITPTSKFDIGKSSFDKEQYYSAKDYFLQVSKNDSNYSEAQRLYKKCNELIAVKEKEEKQKEAKLEKQRKEEKSKRERIEKKYERMFMKTGQWFHEKQDKLARLNFKQYKSGYEDCPDGSSQIATYYKKYEDGYYVHVMLQYSYSMEHHYVRVWVEDE